MNLIKNSSYYIMPLLVAFFNVLIIFVPDLVITSARDGLLLWFNKVIPSIFPFLVGTNLLIHLGFVDFLGTLLEGFMKKFFHVSGCGAFALILGIFSGYPVGAKITASLREHDKLTQTEAQRLISFTNNSGPLFIIGTIGIGMFQNINIGYFILFVHYLSAITVGFLFRFYNYNPSCDYKSVKKTTSPNSNSISLKKALINLKISRTKNNKKFGEILSESVQNSLETIATIGGFIIIFSVIAEIFKASNIFSKIGDIIFPDNISNFSDGIFVGIIEITNGIYCISNNPLASINSNIAIIIATGLISFSGLSILAQTMSIISKSDINIKLYIYSKLLHSSISIIYSTLLIPMVNKIFQISLSIHNLSTHNVPSSNLNSSISNINNNINNYINNYSAVFNNNPLSNNIATTHTIFENSILSFLLSISILVILSSVILIVNSLKTKN